MDLQALKNDLNGLELPAEIKAKMNEILDTAIASGSLSEDGRQKLVDMSKLAVDLVSTTADAHEEMALILTNFADEITRATQINDRDNKFIAQSATAEAEKLEAEMAALGATEPTPTSPAV